MNYSGSIDFSEPPLLEALFLSNKAEMMRCSDLHKSFPTPWGKKIVPALWVVTENAPLYVTRHLFRTIKLHSSRLDWCIFSHNRGGYERSIDPNSDYRKPKQFFDCKQREICPFSKVMMN